MHSTNFIYILDASFYRKIAEIFKTQMNENIFVQIALKNSLSYHKYFSDEKNIHTRWGPGGVRLSVDSATFSQLFYNLREDTKSTTLQDFLKKIVDSTLL